MRAFGPALLICASLAAATAGCGEAVPSANASTTLAPQGPSAPAPRRAELARPAEIVAFERADAVGALERPSALKHFFDASRRLEEGNATGDVRVVQFGDSHTAADFGTGVVRRALQAKFGDGGRGFVALGRPWKSYVQDGVSCGATTSFGAERGHLDHGTFAGDGMYGLAGIALEARAPAARAWTDIGPSSERAEIAYLERPNGGSFDLFVDGVRVVRIGTRGAWPASAFRTFELDGASAHQLEVRTVGDGEVRILGVALDRAAYGMVFDAAGINGARISTCLQWNDTHFAEQLRHRAPALVILAYGTNESTDPSLSRETYERQLVDVLGRVARAVPSASCLLLGPPDRAVRGASGAWTTSDKLLEIIASQRRVAAAAGCAFYDQLKAMGGPGTVAAWAEEDPPRARPDRVHLTRDAYALLGSAFSADLLRAYGAYVHAREPASKPAQERPSATAHE